MFDISHRGVVTGININRAVARSIDILVYLAECKKAVTLSEIAKATDVPKSSALDILYTLMDKGLVEMENSEFKTYRLGITLFTLGTAVINRNDIQTVSQKPLALLSEKTKKTVFLAVPKGDRIVYITKVEGVSPVQSSCPIGATNPMYLTGIGKAILAGMSDQEILEMYGEGPYEVRTPQTLGSYQELMEDIRKTRARGYSIDDREGVEFIYCFGAPVYDYTNKIIASISIVTLVNEIGEEEHSTYSAMAVQTAMEISRRMGYTGKAFYEQM